MILTINAIDLILDMHNKGKYRMESIQAGTRDYVLKGAPGENIGHVYYSGSPSRAKD